jgi:hypothetical protein
MSNQKWSPSAHGAFLHMDEYGRNWHGPYPFTPTDITEHAPGRFGVYQLLYTGYSGSMVAYIGVATGDTIRGRLRKHATGAGNWALGRLGDPKKFSFVYFECDAASARQIESHVIEKRKPPFNTRPEYKHFTPSISVH